MKAAPQHTLIGNVSSGTEKNCLILGAGRSGTSLLAGTLHAAGYFLGDRLLAANPDNPKGFFEDQRVNAINETLLAAVTPPRPPGCTAAGETLLWGWRWLAELAPGAEIPCSPALQKAIERVTGCRRPFCFKDPRFCYTLPAWRPHLRDCVFLCVFRHPAHTAHSIIRVCERGEYLHGLTIDFAGALDRWVSMYRQVLDIHRRRGDWLFLHYRQLLSGAAIPHLEASLNAVLPHRFADAALERCAVHEPVSDAAMRTYEELCELAGCSTAG